MNAVQQDEDARRTVRAFRAGLITRDEMATMLAALHGLDIRCLMGECTHVPEMDSPLWTMSA